MASAPSQDKTIEEFLKAKREAEKKLRELQEKAEKASTGKRIYPTQEIIDKERASWPSVQKTREMISNSERNKQIETMGNINKDFGFTPEQIARVFGNQTTPRPTANRGDVIVQPTGYNANQPTAEYQVGQRNWGNLVKAGTTFADWAKGIGERTKDILSGLITVSEKEPEEKIEEKTETKSESKKNSDNYDVSYTYKQGDTFGQVLKNLGLDEGNLWGDKGTVKYYSDQLWAEQPDVFDSRGNIKVGTTIKLRKRTD